MFKINKENKVDIEAKILYIPEFKEIWIRDKSKNKARAKKEFAFIYYTADYKSEYNVYGLDKAEAIAREIMGDEKYEPDELISKAVERYEKMQESYSMRYLKSVRETVESLMRFYDDLRYKGEKQQNVLEYDPSPVIKGMKDIESILEKLEKWEKKVMSEEENMTIRGGGHIGLFEDKENATWLKNKV